MTLKLGYIYSIKIQSTILVEMEKLWRKVCKSEKNGKIVERNMLVYK